MDRQIDLADQLAWQKRAIHHALCGILAESDAAVALHAWVKKFSATGSVFGGLNQFAREVCETYGQPGRHHELVRAMNRALVGNVNELRPLPDQQPEPVKVKAKVKEEVVIKPSEDSLEPPSVRTPEFDCFKSLLPALMAAIEQHGPQVAAGSREFLIEVVDNLPWSPAQQQQVLDLLNKGDTEQVRPYRQGQLKTLLNHLVVWLQEKIDRETAILIVRQAIKETSNTVAGTAYSPKEFFSK
ncbi:MAG TPA: hypothetical protein VD810_04500 [Methylophilaceae bacterium]|nr:hypothetical protein [Methylophilaceae bacterium]